MRSTPQSILTQQISHIQSLLQEGKIIEAEHQAQNLLQETPNNEELLLLTAKACQTLGKIEASVSHLTNLLKLNQHHAEANKLLANHYFNSSNFEVALTYINAALAQFTSPETQELKGLILAGLHEYDKAIETFLKVVDSEQASWLTWNNLANQYRSLGLFKEAQKSYLKAIELSGFDDTPYNNLITFLHYLPESNKNELKSLYKNWEEKYSRNISATKHQADRALKNKKIRIGMISDGFRTHPVGQMITSALEALPENEIELYAYSTNNAEDQLTYRTKKASEKWMSVAHLSEEKLAQEFINDKIDILFDLCGHNNGCRMRTMAMKPAPILVKWVGGLINTTGLSTMDYLLSDSIETPIGEDGFYTEKLIRMPDDYICYNAPIYTPDIYSPPAKRNGYITLGCFNNPTKLNYVLLSEWAKIMHSLPESRLFLKGFQFSSEVLRENIRNQFKDLGITENRVLIEGPSHHEELLKSYNKVDIALDTWPYSGGLTTCEAMYMGVPVVTYPGPTFAGRHSATHLTNAGMPQLVAESWEHYHDLVITLASDIDNLANIRQHLRGALLESPVCDAKRFARNFSNAMRAIWQRHCEGKQPAALTLDKEGNAQFEDEAEPVQLHLPEEPVLVEDDDFHFRFDGKIVVVDHGAGFTCSESFHTLHKLGAIKTLCIDPGSRIRNAQQLTNTGDFHHFPLTVLGDGSEMELALAVEAERSTTLPIIAPDPDAIIPEQEPPALISTTKVTSNRIDDIDGLEHIDWLILDDQHHNLSILKHGSKKLNSTLLIEVEVSSQEQQPKQISLVEIKIELERLGFTLIPLESSNVKEYPKNNQAVFIPNNSRLDQLKNDDLSKLAFLLYTVYHEEDIATEIINIYLSERKNLNLEKLKNNAGRKKTINLIDYKYIYNIDPFGKDILEKAINGTGHNTSYIKSERDLIRKISRTDDNNEHFFTSHSFYNLTIDSPPYIQKANIFDLYSIRPFSIIDDHAYADFMLNRCYNSPKKITIGSKSQLLIEEFKKISKSNDIIEVIIPQKPPEHDAIEYKNKENCAVFVGKLYPNIPKSIREIKEKIKNENRLNIKEKQEVSDFIERRRICPFAEPELTKDTREITLLYFDYIDKFFRNYYRAKNLSKIIDRLNKLNIKTLIIGGDEKDWKMSIDNNVDFEHVPTTDYRDSLALMNASKFNLNINPSYPDILTDRLVNMLGSNSLCISDNSPLLMTEEYKEIFIGREFITFENLSRAEELAYLQASFANKKFSAEAAIKQWSNCFSKHIENCS